MATVNVCKDNTCNNDVQCAADQYCNGTICMGDLCTPGAGRCEAGSGARVRRERCLGVHARHLCDRSGARELMPSRRQDLHLPR